jgi:hypothetical protein
VTGSYPESDKSIYDFRFHGGDYEEYRFMGCDTMWLLYEPKFHKNIPPPSSGWEESAS